MIITSLRSMGAKDTTISIVTNLHKLAQNKLIVPEWAPENIQTFHEPVKNLNHELTSVITRFKGMICGHNDSKHINMLHVEIVSIEQKYSPILG